MIWESVITVLMFVVCVFFFLCVIFPIGMFAKEMQLKRFDFHCRKSDDALKSKKKDKDTTLTKKEKAADDAPELKLEKKELESEEAD